MQTFPGYQWLGSEFGGHVTSHKESLGDNFRVPSFGTDVVAR